MADHKAIFVSDVHFPKHDPRLVSLWFDVLRYLKPNSVDLVGDIDEAEGTSRWVEGTSKEGFSIADAGIVDTRKFLVDIKGVVPKADKHFHDGNHGWFRHKKWLDKNQPQTLVDETYTPETLYEYEKAGFSFHHYDHPPVHRFGDVETGLYVHHGESVSKHSGESVRNDCLNFGVSLLRGHSHRQGEYFMTYPVTGRTIRGFEIGHLCDYKQMEYINSPNWQAGFAWGIVNGDDYFVDTIEIHNYKCYVAGRVFQG